MIAKIEAYTNHYQDYIKSEDKKDFLTSYWIGPDLEIKKVLFIY